MGGESSAGSGADIGVEVTKLVVHPAGLPDPLTVSITAIGPGSEAEPPEMLVVIDANMLFATVIQLAALLQLTGEIPPVLVVGVGYDLDPIYSNPTALNEFLIRRSRDNLAVTVDLTQMPRKMTRPSGGGAPNLLDGIVNTVIPAIEQRHQIAPGPHALLGHSGGGHFGLYAALARPDIFDRVVAGTPVLFSYELFQSLAASWAQTAEASRTQLFVGTGQLEPADYLDDIHRFIDHLHGMAPSEAHITSHVFDGETHNSVWPAVFARGLRTVLGDFRDGETSATPTVTRNT